MRARKGSCIQKDRSIFQRGEDRGPEEPDPPPLSKGQPIAPKLHLGNTFGKEPGETENVKWSIFAQKRLSIATYRNYLDFQIELSLKLN